MKTIFCHTNNSDFSAQKPTLLKKQPNVICLKLNFEQKTLKPQKTQKPGFLAFSNPEVN
jgi:hypothetical protein